MKLFSLPYLAYSRIITSMCPMEVISLSFCSRKSKERIKEIRFHADYPGISTKVFKSNVPVFRLRFKSLTHQISIPFKSDQSCVESKGRRFTANIDGVEHNIRCVDNQIGSILYSNIIDSQFKIINYVVDLVRGHLKYLVLDLNMINDLKGFITESCLKSVSHIEIVSETVTSEKLSEFFNNMENPTKDVRIFSKVEGRVDPNLNIIQSDLLISDEAEWVTREHLLSFNGKLLLLNHPIFDIETIIEFINQWRNGNNTTLAALKIVELPQEALNRDRFISEFDAKPWDPTKREKCYIHKNEFANRLDNAMDCSEGLDFERHDGLLATIKVIPSCGFFHFYVWHKRFNIA